jgi:hypothetical protein
MNKELRKSLIGVLYKIIIKKRTAYMEAMSVRLYLRPFFHLFVAFSQPLSLWTNFVSFVMGDGRIY